MAINLTQSSDFGIDSTHHVMQAITIDRPSNRIAFKVNSYISDTEYDNVNRAVNTHTFSYDFADLPASVLTKMVELKEILELEMIANLAEWSAGTQVAD